MAHRTYEVIDEGDEVRLQLFEGDMQMGGAVFPRNLDTFETDAWGEACSLGEWWVGND